VDSNKTITLSATIPILENRIVPPCLARRSRATNMGLASRSASTPATVSEAYSIALFARAASMTAARATL
jgi:hypothetical protein